MSQSKSWKPWLRLWQGTIYRNAQLRYSQIVYSTLGRNVNKPSSPTEIQGKGLKLWCNIIVQQKKLMYQVRANTYDCWLSDRYGKYNSNIFLFHPLDPFPSKMMRCPWILPLQFTDLTHQIWRFLVYIFLGLWIQYDNSHLGQLLLILKNLCATFVKGGPSVRSFFLRLLMMIDR